jgi:N-acetylglucosamine-6-phosphate deacetylase
MKLLVTNGRLISPDLDLPGGALLVEGGRILSVHPAADKFPAADEIVDAGGRMVMPGFVDIHSHGADGADVCDGSVDSIHHIARRKLQEGVTTWLPTTLTQPAGRLAEIVAICGEAMGATEFCKMPGIHLEGPFINPMKSGAQNPAFVRFPSVAELEKLHAISPLKLLSLAPEMADALAVIAAATALGIVSSAAHTNATFAEIQAAKAVGLRHLTHFANAMTPLHHREIGAVGAGLFDDDLLLEIIADGAHLSADMLRLIFKCVPIDRLLLITDSVAASWRGDGEMNLGGLPVEIRAGVARLKSNGELAGSTLRFNDGLRRIFETTAAPLSELVKATSWNQARSLGLGRIGKLEAGFAADFVVLESDFSVGGTWVDGLRRF